MERWAEETLEEFGLDIPVTAAHRVAVARPATAPGGRKSLLAQPKVLLLDEPTTALGPEEVERSRRS